MSFPKLSVATGRVVTGLFFILAGINKIVNYTDTVTFMEGAGLPGLLLPLVILLELGGGLIVLIGRGKAVFIATCLSLALFTLAANIAFHAFWTLDEPMRQIQLSLFFKNLVIVGALVTFAGLKAQSTD